MLAMQLVYVVAADGVVFPIGCKFIDDGYVTYQALKGDVIEGVIKRYVSKPEIDEIVSAMGSACVNGKMPINDSIAKFVTIGDKVRNFGSGWDEWKIFKQYILDHYAMG